MYMNKAVRLLWAPMCLLALMVAYPARAQITTINCNTAVHIADFTACAKNNAKGLGLVNGNYWYVTYNSTHHTAVKVNVLFNARGGSFVYSPTAYTASGATALTDTDLGV